MNVKQYNFNDIAYGYSKQSKKWEFKLPGNTTFLTKVPGQAEMAVKIARILAGSVKRSKGVDGLARANIYKMVGA